MCTLFRKPQLPHQQGGPKISVNLFFDSDASGYHDDSKDSQDSDNSDDSDDSDNSVDSDHFDNSF